MRNRTIAAVALALAAATAGACSPGEQDAQPTVDQPRFTEGGFDELPRYPRSDPAGTRTESGDVEAQTFSVPNATPEQVVTWYAERLDAEWELAIEPRQENDTWITEAVQGDRTLRVTAAPAPTIEEQGEQVVQYSLTLTVADRS